MSFVNTEFISLEMLLSQNAPDLPPPPAELDFECLLEFLLETPQPTQGATSDSPPSSIPDTSNLLPQITPSAENRTSICAICSASTSPSPPLPPPQAATSPPPGWHLIQQKSYVYGRKQWDYAPSESIPFVVNGFPGMNMGDAFRKMFTDLNGRDDLVLQDASGTISCRLSVRLL